MGGIPVEALGRQSTSLLGAVFPQELANRPLDERAQPYVEWRIACVPAGFEGDRPEQLFDPTLLVTTNGRFLDTGIDGLPTSVGGGLKPVELGRDGSGAGLDPHSDNAATTPGGTEGDGVFQEGDPRLRARMMIAMQQVQLADWVEGGARRDPKQVVRQITEQVVRAFGRSPAPDPGGPEGSPR